MPSPHPKLSPKGPSGRGERPPYRTLTQGAQRAELALPLALIPLPPPATNLTTLFPHPCFCMWETEPGVLGTVGASQNEG